MKTVNYKFGKLRKETEIGLQFEEVWCIEHLANGFQHPDEEEIAKFVYYSLFYLTRAIFSFFIFFILQLTELDLFTFLIVSRIL